MLPPYVRETEIGIELLLRVVPGTSCDKIVGEHGGRLKVKVSAPADKGQANQGVIDLVSKWLGIKEVSLVSGLTSKEKCVLIRGIQMSKLVERLLEL